jgi:hypothetical protein
MTTITESRPIAPTSARNERAWRRSAAAGGVLFVVLSVASTFVAGAPPASDASAAKITTYFHDHSGAIKVSLLLGGLGVMALLWWLGALWRILSDAESGRPQLTAVAAVALGSGVTLAMSSGTFTAAAAQRADTLGDNVQLLFTLSLITIAAAGFGLSLFLATVCMLNMRARVFPVWTNAVGAVAAAAFLVGTIATTTDANAVNVVALVAFLVWCIWLLGVSTSMWKSAGRQS